MTAVRRIQFAFFWNMYFAHKLVTCLAGETGKKYLQEFEKPYLCSKCLRKTVRMNFGMSAPFETKKKTLQKSIFAHFLTTYLAKFRIRLIFENYQNICNQRQGLAYKNKILGDYFLFSCAPHFLNTSKIAIFQKIYCWIPSCRGPPCQTLSLKFDP